MHSARIVTRSLSTSTFVATLGRSSSKSVNDQHRVGSRDGLDSTPIGSLAIRDEQGCRPTAQEGVCSPASGTPDRPSVLRRALEAQFPGSNGGTNFALAARVLSMQALWGTP